MEVNSPGEWAEMDPVEFRFPLWHCWTCSESVGDILGSSLATPWAAVWGLDIMLSTRRPLILRGNLFCGND
jgi:hypothetical protein